MRTKYTYNTFSKLINEGENYMDYNFGEISVNDYTKKKYKLVGEFKEGLALVQNLNRLYGYINEQGEEVIPCQYYGASGFSEGLACVLPKYGAAYQYINGTGEVVIQCPEKYSNAFSFHCGLARVASGKNKYGYIDKNGFEKIECSLYNAGDFSEGLAVVDKREFGISCSFMYPSAKMRIINTEGQVQEKLHGNYRYFVTNEFHNGLLPIGVYGSFSEARAEYNMISAFLDKDGKVYDKPSQVEELSRFYSGRRPACLGAGDTVDGEKILLYCSTITVLGKKFEIETDSPEELTISKKEFFQSLQSEFNNMIKQNLGEEEKIEGYVPKKAVS